MAKQQGIDLMLDKWRGLIKSKKRQIISTEEIIQNKIKTLKPWIFPETELLEGWEYRQFNYTRHQKKQFTSEQWKPISVGQNWGGEDMSAIFRCKAKLPEKFKGQKVALKVYFGGDSLLTLDGKPYHGLDPFRDTVLLTNDAIGDEIYDFEVESYIMWHFGEGTNKTLECSHFATMDSVINEAYWDLQAVFNLMMTKGLEQDVVLFCREKLYKATRQIDQEVCSYEMAKDMALVAQKIIREEFYQSNAFSREGLIHLCGNSHLDLVYLWNYAEFVRKIGRTHSTAVRLMEQYPDYKFSQSQALMYKQMKESYPTLFEEVKQRVKEGRWEVIGAFWVEPDCNLISGESMVRQILHGVNFFEEEFGITPKTAWIPDSFGCQWTMPQILIKSGLEYFVTYKMALWNDTNDWKETVFQWQGPDGSRIFSVVPPTHFIGTLEPDHMKDHWDNYSCKASIGETFYAYGWGDGGGGPDTEMLEYAKRYKSMPGMVPTQTSTIEQALEAIHSKSLSADVPVINDELYLEEHRGVYTTKGKLKKLNRYCENLYRKAEFYAYFANLFSPAVYPHDELKRGWEAILTNQFHDSLPGTHITSAYHDILDTYEVATKIGESILQYSLTEITSSAKKTCSQDNIFVFNSCEFIRDSIARMDYPESVIHILDRDGNEVPHQFVSSLKDEKKSLVFLAKDLPSMGYKQYQIVKGPGKQRFPVVTVLKCRLENEYLKVQLNGNGEITSFFDKKLKRDSIDSEKRGNVMKLYEDISGTFDAWDIVPNYTDLEFDMGDAEIEVIDQGPVLSAVRITREFFNSKIVQIIKLSVHSKRLDFETMVDWKDQHKLLKTRFHTNVIARRATYDIAYGNIERSAYYNNSYEKAKYEVCGHKWADLSESDFGLSLLNDCKYGYEIHDQMMALSLLRGPKYPDPVSDQEEHFFTYSLYSHHGTWKNGQTIQAAADLNDPVDVILCESKQGKKPDMQSLISLNCDNFSIEAVKKAEKSNDLILRLVEQHGSRSQVEVTFCLPIIKSVLCDLLEREIGTIDCQENKIILTMKPYEITTLKLSLDPAVALQ